MELREILRGLRLPLAIASVSATAWAYVVKEGDTLTRLAYTHISKNVYGDRGSLKRIIALNPQVKNPNFITPGEVIFLEEATPRAPASEVQVTVEAPASIEIAEPAPVQTEPSPALNDDENLFRRSAFLALEPYFSILSLQSRDNSTRDESTIASSYNAGVTANYGQKWSPSFATAVNLKIGKIDFEKPVESIRTLEKSDKLLTSIGIETNHQLSEKLNLTISADYSKEIFVRAISTQSDVVEAAHIPSLGARVAYEIVNLDPFAVGVIGKYRAQMPAKLDGYQARRGHEFGVGLQLKQFSGSAEDSRIETGLEFNRRTQNTNLSSQKETSIVLTFKYSLPVGKKQGAKP